MIFNDLQSDPIVLKFVIIYIVIKITFLVLTRYGHQTASKSTKLLHLSISVIDQDITGQKSRMCLCFHYQKLVVQYLYISNNVDIKITA